MYSLVAARQPEPTPRASCFLGNSQCPFMQAPGGSERRGGVLNVGWCSTAAQHLRGLSPRGSG